MVHLLVFMAGAAVAQGGGGGFVAPTTIGGAVSDRVLAGLGTEMAVFEHKVGTVSGRSHGAYLNHFWSAGGKGPVGMYVADRQVVRYYVDDEIAASIVFEPARACGSGMGFQGLRYYEAGYNAKEPWGPQMSNTWAGHSAATGGGWHNRYVIPFSRSIRITVQLPQDVPTNTSSKVFFIFRGVEGDPSPLSVGSIRLPPTVLWNLRLRKLELRRNQVEPLDFVSLINYTSQNIRDGPAASAAGGALFFSVFSINPFGSALEGCIRAYTSATGPLSDWPGLLLSSGTEDYYDSAYYFSHEAEAFYGEDAGLSHKSLGGDQPKLASMFRFHTNDPVYFSQRLELVWRNGELVDPATGTNKCLLRENGTQIGGERVDLTFDSWLYTWDDPAGVTATAAGL